jgi:hypothetical protein
LIYFWNAIKYLLSVAATPVSLLLLWIFNIRPFELILKITGWKLDVTNVETITAAIDLALLVLIYNVIYKLLSLIEKPVTMILAIEDPRNPDNYQVVKHNPSDGLVKLKFTASVDYKSSAFKTVTKLGCEHYFEFHWSDWLELEIDDIIGINGLYLSQNRWGYMI